MANSNRRYIDKNGKMFIPMNVEGGSWTEHFITMPKLICLGGILITAVIIYLWLSQSLAPFTSYIILYGLWVIISSLLLRFVVFEEKFYYKMYKQLESRKITTPSVFWDLVSIKDGPEGAVFTYSDAKIGVICRLDRDTITGKPEEFIEFHYDAISDFYREIMLRKYSFVQLNIMEQAGNDPRLDELNKLTNYDGNKNIRELMELQIGHIKNITHHTLYESDYILIYTSDLTKVDSIISDAIDIIYKILDGAYIGYSVLRSKDISEIVKEEYGVRYFNSTEAVLTMFRDYGVQIKNPFIISKILYTDGDTQDIGQQENYKINKITKDIESNIVNAKNISIKNMLYTNEQKSKNKGVDFESLSYGFGTNNNTIVQSNNKNNTQIKNSIGNGLNINNRNNNNNMKNNDVSIQKNDNTNIQIQEDDEFIDF